MTTNERIRSAAYAMARGEIDPPQSGYQCLRAVRLIVERALWQGDYRLYDEFLPVGTSRRTGDDVGRHKVDPWASDIEASMKHLGLAVPHVSRAAGDLIFNHNALPPWGHVGVLLESGLVLESVDVADRPMSIPVSPFLCLTQAERFNATLVARLPQDL